MPKVLTADDDALVVEVIAEWLTGEGYSVDTARNGLECRNKLADKSYDLIILDWDMPEITGLDLLKEFRESGGNTPVLLLTGRTQLDDKTLGFDSGADDYLTKPFQPKELSARVKAILRRMESRIPKPLGAGNEELLSDGGLLGSALAAKYEFQSVLGEGGAGIVYKARHPQLDKLVAVKMLHFHGMKPEVFARFEQEARLVSRLNHPSIATIYDYGVTERKRPYMVMEFIDGRGLDYIIRERDHLPVKEAISVFSQICDGLSHAHAAGVIHRDLKPSNIMLGNNPAVPIKILDFGCAKLRDLHHGDSVGLTKDGSSLGTPSYMSPEQVRGMTVDERSDVYSLGCVIYEAITGYVLHLGENAAQTMFKQLEENVPLMSAMNPELVIPDALEQVVARALDRDMNLRYQSMRDFKLALTSVPIP